MRLKEGDIVIFNWEEGIYNYFIEKHNQRHFKTKGWTHTGTISKVDNKAGIVYIHEAIWTKGKA